MANTKPRRPRGPHQQKSTNIFLEDGCFTHLKISWRSRQALLLIQKTKNTPAERNMAQLIRDSIENYCKAHYPNQWAEAGHLAEKRLLKRDREAQKARVEQLRAEAAT